MDRQSILAEFDRQMREDPPRDPGTTLDRSTELVCVLGPRSWIAFSRLNSESAPREVEIQAHRFREIGGGVEWKVYGHDQPPELPRLLAEHGFSPDPSETLMVLDLGRIAPRPACDDKGLRSEIDGLHAVRQYDLQLHFSRL